MGLSVAKALADLTEKEWEAQLFNSQKGLAPMLGWRLNYHTLRSKGSRSGFPDRVLIRDRVIFAELKREDGKPTDNQIEFLDGLARAGGEVYLWRPSDFEEIGRVLSKRWRFCPVSDEEQERGRPVPPYLATVQDGPFEPGSMWIPGIGRRDQRPVQQPEHPDQLALA